VAELDVRLGGFDQQVEEAFDDCDETDDILRPTHGHAALSANTRGCLVTAGSDLKETVMARPHHRRPAVRHRRPSPRLRRRRAKRTNEQNQFRAELDRLEAELSAKEQRLADLRHAVG